MAESTSPVHSIEALYCWMVIKIEFSSLHNLWLLCIYEAWNLWEHQTFKQWAWGALVTLIYLKYTVGQPNYTMLNHDVPWCIYPLSYIFLACTYTSSTIDGVGNTIIYSIYHCISVSHKVLSSLELWFIICHFLKVPMVNHRRISVLTLETNVWTMESASTSVLGPYVCVNLHLQQEETVNNVSS